MIEPSLEINLDDLEKCIIFLNNLKYTAAILDVQNIDVFQDLNNFQLKKEESPIKTNFSLFTRSTLQDLGTKEKNKRNIDFWREKIDFLVQKCNSPEVTKWASQDQRIDALQFDLLTIHSLLDLSTARLMSENDKFLEINIKQFLGNQNNIIKVSRNLLKALKKVQIKEVPIIFSTYSSSIYDLIGIFELKGILSFLNIKHEFYFDFSQINLLSKLQKNNERLRDQFIVPGIKRM
jgi:RNase P/RNase MRP subunit p30